VKRRRFGVHRRSPDGYANTVPNASSWKHGPTLSRSGPEIPPAFAQEMQTIAEQAHTLKPRAETWGFFAYSDGPGDTGGGTGRFLWFESREQMFDFMKQYLPFWCPGPANSDVRVVAKIREILAASLNASVLEDLNQALRSYAKSTDAADSENFLFRKFRSLVRSAAGFGALLAARLKFQCCVSRLRRLPSDCKSTESEP